jgi:hypothetical protein
MTPRLEHLLYLIASWIAVIVIAAGRRRAATEHVADRLRGNAVDPARGMDLACNGLHRVGVGRDVGRRNVIADEVRAEFKVACARSYEVNLAHHGVPRNPTPPPVVSHGMTNAEVAKIVSDAVATLPRAPLQGAGGGVRKTATRPISGAGPLRFCYNRS